MLPMAKWARRTGSCTVINENMEIQVKGTLHETNGGLLHPFFIR